MSSNRRSLHSTGGALVAAALLQACSGGGGPGGAPATQAPRIVGLGSIVVDQDTTSSTQSFRIEDADTPVAQLAIEVESSDPALLPLRGIVIEGSGDERRLRVTPAAESVGRAILTLTVRDTGGLTATRRVDVRVDPVLVEFGTLATAAFAARDGSEAVRVSGVTVQSTVDDDPRAFDALLQAGEQ